MRRPKIVGFKSKSQLVRREPELAQPTRESRHPDRY